MDNIVDIITQFATPIIDVHQFELVNVEWVNEDNNWYVRLYIDKPNGITIDECALVSNELSKILDEVDPDPIYQSYILEVSSPGLERPLISEQDYKLAIGQYIHVSLYQKIFGEKVYEGILMDLSEADLNIKIHLKDGYTTFTIPRINVAKARLAIKF